MKEFYPFFVDYIPLIISNVIVIAFFLFFQKNTKKVKTSYKSKIAEFEKGNLTIDDEVQPSTQRKGTKVSFTPDESIFSNYKYRNEYIIKMKTII